MLAACGAGKEAEVKLPLSGLKSVAEHSAAAGNGACGTLRIGLGALKASIVITFTAPAEIARARVGIDNAALGPPPFKTL